MLRSTLFTALATILLAGAAAAAPPASAPPANSPPKAEAPSQKPGTAPKVVRERKVVVVAPDDSGQPVVLHHLSGAYLGVELTQLTPELRTHFGVPDDRGVMVARVEKDSPAAKAGLAVGDIITAIDGEAVDSTWNLSLAIRRHDAEDSVDLAVRRDGRSLDVNATLGQREREQIDLGQLLQDGKLPLVEGMPKVKGMRWYQATDGEDGDGDEATIVIRPEVVRELGESLGKVDWPALDGRLRERNRELEKRLDTLEQRLQELEKRLDASDGK